MKLLVEIRVKYKGNILLSINWFNKNELTPSSRHHPSVFGDRNRNEIPRLSCKNGIFTLSCLPICTQGVGGHWTLTLTWVSVDGFLPFFSDAISVIFIKVHGVCLASGFPHCDYRRGKVGAMNSLFVRQKPSWAYRSHHSFLSPQRWAPCFRDLAPDFLLLMLLFSNNNSRIPSVVHGLWYPHPSKTTAVSRSTHSGSRAPATQYCGFLSAYMGCRVSLRVKEHPSPTTNSLAIAICKLLHHVLTGSSSALSRWI